MRIRLLKQICGAEGSFEAGDVAEVSDALAEGLFDGGYAVPEPAADVETAEIGPAETAVVRSNPKRRGKA